MLNDKEYTGRVIYIDDPTFSGRCKVRVFGLFEGLDDELIPWFSPASPSVFSGEGGGALSVPKVNSIVKVRFQNNNVYSGEYTSTQFIDPALVDEIKDDYEGSHILLFDSERDLVVTYQPLSGIKIYLGGSQIKVDADGSIQLKHRNNSNVVEVNENEINITTAGDGGSNTNGRIFITASAEVTVNAPTVNVESTNISLGKNASSSVVKGEKLVDVLKQIVVELETKAPQNVSSLSGRTFKEILSTDVKTI